jgi:hypothetical protein
MNASKEALARGLYAVDDLFDRKPYLDGLRGVVGPL